MFAVSEMLPNKSQAAAHDPVPGDPIQARMHILSNGMKLYMSVNDAEPRIYTQIAVRAGSKHDPSETTGLAHYLEHMMFKGTRRIGALDWEQEKRLLDEIADLYERHRAETDPARRSEIYRRIDAVSHEAAKLAAANEYDKITNVLGAKGTNAYTWVEQTVYVNDIPSNELQRWMQLESERFREVVLRLFHTELETVYEEFNMTQDKDFRKVSKAMNAALYPAHPYGTRTTMGEGEHLKNPSHFKILEFFGTYYRPNNMALILAGDFDPDEAFRLAEAHFGNYRPALIPPFSYEKQPPLTQPVRLEIFGQEASYLQIGWRFGGAGTADADYLALIARLLYNGRAGLIDLDLLQGQRLLNARAYTTTMEDFSTFQLYGKPREGQSLEEVETLLLSAIEKIKRGDFPDWLPPAIVKDMKLTELRANENNSSRAAQMTNAFILGMDWAHHIGRFGRLEAIGKADIVRFAQAHLGDNHVVAYKRQGPDPNVMKVEKPPITPVPVNRAAMSDFTKKFLESPVPSLQPVFLDYEKEITSLPTTNGPVLDFIKNKNNPIFTLSYVVEMGRNSDREFALAMGYLPYLGTSRYSPDKLKQAFFRLGLNFGVTVNEERAYITLAGLDESLEEGLQLLEHILADVKGDDTALRNLVADVLLQRENSKQNKDTILQDAMYARARYGTVSPFTDRLSPERLRSVTPQELVDKIKQVNTFEHRIFYYGSKTADEVARLLERHHRVPDQLRPAPPATAYAEMPTLKNRVLFVDFPMVQAEIMFVSKGTERFSLEEHVMSELYNAYFGSGMSSVVFQEIRESRALAYSTNVRYLSPNRADKAHYLRGYVGTQADKMPDAICAVQQILEDMPHSEKQIAQAAVAIRKKIETSRIRGENIYWNYRTAQRRGLAHDVRSDVYDAMATAVPADLLSFHESYVKGRCFTFLVLGSRASVDMGYLRSLGEVEELSVEEVFRLV